LNFCLGFDHGDATWYGSKGKSSRKQGDFLDIEFGREERKELLVLAVETTNFVLIYHRF
jgi:hypothetical protein